MNLTKLKNTKTKNIKTIQIEYKIKILKYYFNYKYRTINRK